jgi:hypothetical protein
MNKSSKLSLLCFAVGVIVLATKSSEKPSLGAWHDKALQVESQQASGEFEPDYRIRLDHAYEEAGDVNRPKIQVTLLPAIGKAPISTGRAVSIRCNGNELISTSLDLMSVDLRLEFSCIGTRYRVSYVDPNLRIGKDDGSA